MSDLDPVVVVRRGRREQLTRRRRVRLASIAVVVVVLALGAATVQLVVHRGPVEVAAGAGTTTTTSSTTTTTTTTTAPPPPTVPPDQVLPPSGEGRRVVFSVGRQRVWWVDDAGAVLRTSLVSGREGTPDLGTFRVYSKSERATGLDGSRMDHFVRFTKGPNGWAIGFHDIPEVDGVPVQTVEQLGQPLSHGCIRQSDEDAAFTWGFLEVGDTVVVVA